MTNLSYERYKLMQEQNMKTFKLNGHEVKVCCDQMHVDLVNGKYYSAFKSSVDDGYLKTHLLSHECEFGSTLVGVCPHCKIEVKIK